MTVLLHKPQSKKIQQNINVKRLLCSPQLSQLHLLLFTFMLRQKKYKKQIEQALQGNAAVVQLASVGVTLATVLRVVVEICHSIVSEAT